MVYGTRDSGLLDAYRIVARGFRPEIGARKWISLIHVRDLVEGLLLAAEAPKAANEVFFLADPEPIAMPELWAQVALSMGARTIRLPVPDRVVRWAGALVEDGASWAGKSTLFGRDKALEMTQKAWTCRATKAARMLGWNPRRRLDEAMRETLEWYKSRRLL